MKLRTVHSLPGLHIQGHLKWIDSPRCRRWLCGRTSGAGRCIGWRICTATGRPYGYRQAPASNTGQAVPQLLLFFRYDYHFQICSDRDRFDIYHGATLPVNARRGWPASSFLPEATSAATPLASSIPDMLAYGPRRRRFKLRDSVSSSRVCIKRAYYRTYLAGYGTGSNVNSVDRC